MSNMGKRRRGSHFTSIRSLENTRNNHLDDLQAGYEGHTQSVRVKGGHDDLGRESMRKDKPLYKRGEDYVKGYHRERSDHGEQY